MIIKSYQVTIYCKTNQYKPISTIVKIEQQEDANLLQDKEKKREIINKGIAKICQQKYWTKREMQQYNYTMARAREHNRAIN